MYSIYIYYKNIYVVYKYMAHTNFPTCRVMMLQDCTIPLNKQSEADGGYGWLNSIPMVPLMEEIRLTTWDV